MGTTELEITIGTSGRVEAVKIRGESAMSTAAAACIAAPFKSVAIAPFEGEALTVSRQLTPR